MENYRQSPGVTDANEKLSKASTDITTLIGCIDNLMSRLKNSGDVFDEAVADLQNYNNNLNALKSDVDRLKNTINANADTFDTWYNKYVILNDISGEGDCLILKSINSKGLIELTYSQKEPSKDINFLITSPKVQERPKISIQKTDSVLSMPSRKEICNEMKNFVGGKYIVDSESDLDSYVKVQQPSYFEQDFFGDSMENNVDTGFDEGDYKNILPIQNLNKEDLEKLDNNEIYKRMRYLASGYGFDRPWLATDKDIQGAFNSTLDNMSLERQNDFIQYYNRLNKGSDTFTNEFGESFIGSKITSHEEIGEYLNNYQQNNYNN